MYVKGVAPHDASDFIVRGVKTRVSSVLTTPEHETGAYVPDGQSVTQSVLGWLVSFFGITVFGVELSEFVAFVYGITVWCFKTLVTVLILLVLFAGPDRLRSFAAMTDAFTTVNVVLALRHIVVLMLLPWFSRLATFRINGSRSRNLRANLMMFAVLDKKFTDLALEYSLRESSSLRNVQVCILLGMSLISFFSLTFELIHFGQMFGGGPRAGYFLFALKLYSRTASVPLRSVLVEVVAICSALRYRKFFERFRSEHKNCAGRGGVHNLYWSRIVAFSLDVIYDNEVLQIFLALNTKKKLVFREHAYFGDLSLRAMLSALALRGAPVEYVDKLLSEVLSPDNLLRFLNREGQNFPADYLFDGTSAEDGYLIYVTLFGLVWSRSDALQRRKIEDSINEGLLKFSGFDVSEFN